MPTSSSPLSQWSGQLPSSTRSLSVLGFTAQYWRPQLRMIMCSAVTMLLATALSICIPLTAKELATYGSDRASGATAKTDSVAPSASSGGGSVTSSITDGVGRLSERLFMDYVPVVRSLSVLSVFTSGPLGLSEADTSTAATTTVSVSFLQGLLCRALLMALSVVLYHTISLVAHLAAYRAGMATRCSMTEDCLRRILSTPRPERIAVVNAVKLSQLISTSARTSGDALGALLTDVLSCAFAAVGLLVALLYISYPLTLVIGAMVCFVQYVYFIAGRHQGQRGAEVAVEESSVQAYLNNGIQRSETIVVFDCRAFILDRLQEKLDHLRHLSDALNLSIHGYAAVSSGSTTLIFVVVLSLSNYYHRKGSIAMMDIALYFMFLQQFVNRLLQLSKDVSQTRATLGRLRTLQHMMAWYDAPLEPAAATTTATGSTCGAEAATATKAGAEETRKEKEDDFTVGETGCPASVVAGDTKPPHKRPLPRSPSHVTQAVVEVSDDPNDEVRLDSVAFTYPKVPAFFSESGADGDGGAAAATGVDEANSSSSSSTVQDLATAVVAASPEGTGIRGMSLSAAPHQITALYGPSGCGKSTCLRLLCGLVRPHRGVVHTHRQVVLLEQQHAIFLGTVAENVLLRDLHPPELLATAGTSTQAMPTKEHHRQGSAPTEDTVSKEDTQRVREAVVKSGCDGFLTDPFHTLIENVDHPQFSGGQLQRLCLARVFGCNPHCTLVLLDEPTTGLDSASVGQILVTIKELRDVYGKTVLISTHDQRVAQIADKVIELDSSFFASSA